MCSLPAPQDCEKCVPPSTFPAACPSYILGGIFVLGKNKQLQQQKKGGITAIHFKPSVFKIDGVREIVRLLVINTPELGDNPEMFAVEARDYLEYVLSHAESIYLQTDKKSDLRDSTERRRLLCWLWVDNELVNYNLVRLGYAKVKYIQSEKLRYLKNLRYAERLAKEENLRIHSVSRNIEEELCI